MGQKSLFSKSNIESLAKQMHEMPAMPPGGHVTFTQFEPVPTDHPAYNELLKINHDTVIAATLLKDGRVFSAMQVFAEISQRSDRTRNSLLALQKPCAG